MRPSVLPLAVACLLFACTSEESTRIVLDVTTDTVGQQLPEQLRLTAFVDNRISIDDERYGRPNATLPVKDGNRFAELSIEVEEDLDKPRRFWVRAVRAGNLLLLAEAAVRITEPLRKGELRRVPMPLSWQRLPDQDGDEIPDVIDDCPGTPDDGTCGGTGTGADAGFDAGAGMDVSAQPPDAEASEADADPPTDAAADAS